MIDILVLCYHAVSPTWRADLSVTPDSLERQIQILLRRGYRPATFTQALLAPPAERTFAVTFDDGYRSVHELAFPILRRLGTPATLFVPTALLGEGRRLAWPGIDHWLQTPEAAELESASWDQVRELRDAGWEIGSHSRSHPRLTTLDDAMLDEELAGSKAEIEERLGQPCRSIAYPYGDVDTRVVAAAGRAGYETAGTLPTRFPPRPLPLMWPRVGVYRDNGDAAFRRRTSRTARWVAASPAMGVVAAVRSEQRARRRRPDAPQASTARPLRLLADRQAVVSNRAAVLATGAVARTGALQAYTLWPTAAMPCFVVEAGHAQAAAWLRETFEPEARRLARRAPVTWNLARARALALPRGPGLALEAAERGLGRELHRPRVAAFSPSGAGVTKVTSFVFEGEAAEPSVVVKAMADPGQAGRLRAEVELVADLRARLSGSPEVAAALPVEPLLADRLGGEYVVVEPLDPLAPGTGHAGRERSAEWLRRFHAATAEGERPWDDADERPALARLRAATGFPDPVLERAEARLRALRGASLPVCAVHGDFWRGNLAEREGALRVYDWEWARRAGRPLLDVWTYELAELLERARAGRSDAALRTEAAAALERVGAELETRGLAAAPGLATCVPALAEVSFRIRELTGRAGPNEAAAARLAGVLDALAGKL